MIQIKRFFSAALALLLLLTVAACDSNGAADDDDVRVGSFTVTVSGDIETTVEGSAYFGEAEDPDTGEEVFALVFTESDDPTNTSGTYFFIGRNADQPSEGSFAFAESDQGEDIPASQFVLISQIGATPASATTYVSQGGTLTIDESGSNSLEGSLNVEATGFQVSGEQAQELEVTIEGTFDAVGDDEVFVPFAG